MKLRILKNEHFKGVICREGRASQKQYLSSGTLGREGKALSQVGIGMDVAGVYKILATVLGWEKWERSGCKRASYGHLILSLTLSYKSPHLPTEEALPQSDLKQELIFHWLIYF